MCSSFRILPKATNESSYKLRSKIPAKTLLSLRFLCTLEINPEKAAFIIRLLIPRYFYSTNESIRCCPFSSFIDCFKSQTNTVFIFLSSILSILWTVFLNFQYLNPFLRKRKKYLSFNSFSALIIFFKILVNFVF